MQKNTSMSPIRRKQPKNPFILKTVIPERYFCDREEDTRKIISLLENGNDIVMTAERRIGKSSLIRHILDKKEIQARYNTLYVDILNTHSPEDFINAMKSAISDPDKSTFNKDFNARFDKITREYNAQIGVRGPINGTLGYKEQRVLHDKNVIEEIFQMIASSRRPNIIAFDEFQQIESYDDNITALLRSKFQMMENTQFIFSGSSIHLLPSIFVQYNMPFYGSAELYALKKIPENVYTDFCQKMFGIGKKNIEPEAVSMTYNLFYGTTQQMQQVMNRVYDITFEGETADESTIMDAVEDILEQRGDAYETFLTTIKSQEERNLIYAIAQEGIGSTITSKAMMKKYDIGTPSTVFKRIKKLSSEENKVLTNIGKDKYILTDKYLELWIAQQLGILDFKFNTAKAQYDEYKDAKKPKVSLSKGIE